MRPRSVLPYCSRAATATAAAPSIRRDLNPGANIALSPALTPEQKAVYNSWGKGKYDPRFNFDGTAHRSSLRHMA